MMVSATTALGGKQFYFIYVFERQADRDSKQGGEGEGGSLLSGELNLRLDPRALRS